MPTGYCPFSVLEPAGIRRDVCKHTRTHTRVHSHAHMHTFSCTPPCLCALTHTSVLALPLPLQGLLLHDMQAQTARTEQGGDSP